MQLGRKNAGLFVKELLRSLCASNFVQRRAFHFLALSRSNMREITRDACSCLQDEQLKLRCPRPVVLSEPPASPFCACITCVNEFYCSLYFPLETKSCIPDACLSAIFVACKARSLRSLRNPWPQPRSFPPLLSHTFSFGSPMQF